MNEVPISPDIWQLAGQILTAKQLQVLQLRERNGYSWNMICITLNIDRRTARDHYAAASRKIYNALEQQRLDDDSHTETRATSEETPEEKSELNRIWAETRPAPEGGPPEQRRVTLRSEEPDHMPPNQAGP